MVRDINQNNVNGDNIVRDNSGKRGVEPIKDKWLTKSNLIQIAGIIIVIIIAWLSLK